VLVFGITIIELSLMMIRIKYWFTIKGGCEKYYLQGNYLKG